ncbi:lactate utilization protein [Planctomycetota bacterium]
MSADCDQAGPPPLVEVAAALAARGFEALVASDRDEAQSKVLAMIPQGAVVAWGGSVTLEETGIRGALRRGSYEVIDTNEEGLDRAENLRRRKLGLSADVYLASLNALTYDGVLVNVDGFGNRVAAMIYGPGRVVLVVGRNKLRGDVHSALRRVKEIASPKNCERLQRDTTCRQAGACGGFDPSVCICRATAILHGCPTGSSIAVVLVDDELGY